MSKFKQFLINAFGTILGLLAIPTSMVGCMELLSSKDFFGLKEDIWFVIVLFYSLMVGAFAAQGFKNFLFGLYEKDKKK